MFADEPTGNLDSRTGAEILALLRESVDGYGQTTVMVTHDPHAAAIADRILFLADGQIVKDLGPSTTHEILAALEEVTASMIGVALKGLLGRKLRAALTAFAIVLGVAMISGAFVLTDTLGKSFDGIYEESYEATDAVISSKVAIETQDGETEAPAFSAAVLGDVESLPGVRVAQGIDRGRGKPRRQGRRADRAPRPGRRDGRRSDRRPEPEPVPARLAASGRAATARSRSTSRPRRSSTSRSDRPSAPTATARSKTYEISGIVRFGSEDALGGITDLRLRPRDRPAAVRQGGQVRPDQRRRRGRRDGGRARPARSSRCSPRRCR